MVQRLALIGFAAAMLATDVSLFQTALPIRFETVVSADCSPQCTDFVYGATKINFSKCWNRKQYGDAGQWISYAQRCGFAVSAMPTNNSIFEIPSPNHVGIVTSSAYDARTRTYNLLVFDSNWAKGQCRERRVQATYNPTARMITFADGRSSYPVNGFITRWY